MPGHHRSGARVASWIVASSAFLTTLAVNLQAPMYHEYAVRAGLGATGSTVVFACYIAGLLPVLLLLGGVSDRVGRRPVIIGSLALALAATLGVMLSPGVGSLLAARILQGIAVALGLGAAAAWLAELHGPERAAFAALVTAATTSVGFGGGALLTSIALWRNPGEPPASYALVAGLLLLGLVCCLALPAAPPRGGPLLRLPAYPRGALAAGVAIATAWSVTGMVISVLPAALSRSGMEHWSGPALFVINGAGAAVQSVARLWAPRTSLAIGSALLPVGYAVVVSGVAAESLPLILLGAVATGAACYGFTYLGGLEFVTLAGGASPARAVAGYLLFAYLGFALPAIGVGLLADAIGAHAALWCWLGVVTLLCAATLWALDDPEPAMADSAPSAGLAQAASGAAAAATQGPHGPRRRRLRARIRQLIRR